MAVSTLTSVSYLLSSTDLPGLGGAGVGLVWGWLVADRVFVRWGSRLALFLLTGMPAAFIFWYAGWPDLLLFLGAAGLGLALCTVWRRQLAIHTFKNHH